MLDLIESYAQGARESTAGKPMYDGNIDFYSSAFAAKTRKQIQYLNANTTDIASLVGTITLLTIGSSVSTQVETNMDYMLEEKEDTLILEDDTYNEEEEDNSFNEKAEKIIEYHEKIGVGELTNVYNGNSAKAAISDFEQLNGGVIVVHHYNTSWNFPYKYEIISVDRVDISKNTYLYDNQDLRTTNGLVFNKYNQQVGIWLYTDDKKTSSTLVSMKNITYHSEAWISLGQRLAVSKLISMLPTLDRVDQYGKAALDEAIESAKAGGYLKTSAFDEIMHLVKEQIDKVGKGEDTYAVKKDMYKQILQELSKLGVKPHGVTPIPLTDEVQFNPKQNQSIYTDMNDNSERKMASSQGFSQMSVFKRIDKANYSSSKLALESDARMGDARFNEIKDIYNEINKRIVITAVQIGWLKAPKDFFKNIDRIMNFRYICKKDIDIEPAKRAAANKVNLELGLTNERTIIEARTGMKYEAFLLQTKRDKALKKKILGDDTIVLTPIKEKKKK